MTAHETIGYEVEEKVPAVDASAQQVTLLTIQLAAMSSWLLPLPMLSAPG